MARTCENCEKLKVCWVKNDNPGVVNCGEWSGWMPVEEELPEEGRDVLCICENKKGHHAQFVMWHDNVWIFQGHVVPCKVLEWRELPKYEGRKE